MNELDEILKLANCAPEAEELLEVADSFDIELSEDFVIETGIVGLVEDGVVISGDDKMISLLEEHGFVISEKDEDHSLTELMHKLDMIEAGEDTGITDVLRDIANGKLDGYKVYTQPKNPAEKEISNMIYSKFSSTLKSYRDQDKPEPDDLDKVIDDIIADLTKEHKVDEMMIMGNSNEPSESVQMEAEYQGRKVTLGKPFLTPDGPKKRSVYVKKPNGKVVKVNFGDKKMRIKKSNPARRKSFRARHRCENPGPRWKARYWACRTW